MFKKFSHVELGKKEQEFMLTPLTDGLYPMNVKFSDYSATKLVMNPLMGVGFLGMKFLCFK